MIQCRRGVDINRLDNRTRTRQTEHVNKGFQEHKMKHGRQCDTHTRRRHVALEATKNPVRGFLTAALMQSL